MLRDRWILISGAIVIAVLGALAYSLLVTPRYEASTVLFVSATGDGNATQTNDGGIFAQRRVLTYVPLLTGRNLAQRTIDKLNLDMSPKELQDEITAVAPTDTVLINVTVTDPSPSRARDIANTLSNEFVTMVAGLESSDEAVRPDSEIIVQQRAEVPEHPATPKKFRNVAIAAVLGAVLGTLIALVRDRLDQSVKTPAAVESAAGVGLVGDIPLDAQRRKEPLISFATDRSRTADAFRELRLNVQTLETGDGPRVVAVASPAPGEGRTTTVINLALALAETDSNVVVVDGDFRRPRLAAYLGIPADLGLSTVLSGQASLQQALQGTRFPRVTALAAGAVPPNSADLLGTRAAQDVLDELGGQFDYVIVDSSPLLVPDGATLARYSQGVLLIARFGQTKRPQLARAAEMLRRAGAPLLGAVLTMTPSKKKDPVDSYYGPAGRAPAKSAGRRRDRPAS